MSFTSAVRAAGVGVLVLALLVGGYGSTPDAHAATGTPVMEDPVLSEDQLVAWFNARKPSTVCNDHSWVDGVWVCHKWVPYEFRAGDGAVSVRGLVRRYLEEGVKEGIAGDIAFVQAILETGWFFFSDSGQVRPADNNFAGMGAFDSGTHQPFQFPTVRVGVRAQMQHLRLYADPTTATDGSNLGSPLAKDVDNRYPGRWRVVRNITDSNGNYAYAGRAPRWEDFGNGMWATDKAYASKILNLYSAALTYNGYPADAATYEGRGCRSAVTTGGSHLGAATEIMTVRPARLLDTRNSTQGPRGAIGRRSTSTLPVLGRAGVPSSNVDAVVVNVTALNATSQSYLTVWPSGTSRPGTSTLNPQQGQLTSNEVIVPVGSNGSISIYNHVGSVDALVDIVGYVPKSSSYTTVRPARLLDTRNSTQGPKDKLGRRGTCNIKVAGAGGVPSDAKAVVLNLTTLNATSDSYVTIWPGGISRPGTSTLNPQKGQLTSNEVVVPLGTDGSINLYNHVGSVDALLDVVGYMK